MKISLFYRIITAAFAVIFFPGPAAATHEGFAPERKDLFTKHFQQSFFDITQNGKYSVELLPDDSEYPIGQGVIGIIIHNAEDEDVLGAALVIISKDLDTHEEVPVAKVVVTDKGNGLYTVSGIKMENKGKWELSVTVKKDGVEDSAKFVFPDALKNRYPKGRYSP